MHECLKIFLASGESHWVVFGCWMSLLLLRVVDDCSRGKDDSNGESSSWMSLLSPKSSTWHNEVVARFDETSVPPLSL